MVNPVLPHWELTEGWEAGGQGQKKGPNKRPPFPEAPSSAAHPAWERAKNGVHSALGRPPREYRVQLWASQIQKDVDAPMESTREGQQSGKHSIEAKFTRTGSF